MERRLAGQGDPASASIKQLGMPANIAAGLRYQLIHRTVSILLEAQTIGARKAVLLIQSFGSDHSPTGFADFQMFGAVLGAPITDTGILSPAVELDGIELRLGWSVCSPRRRTDRMELARTPSFRLDDKRALITGGGRGIGLRRPPPGGSGCTGDARGASTIRGRSRRAGDPRARRSRRGALSRRCRS